MTKRRSFGIPRFRKTVEHTPATVGHSIHPLVPRVNVVAKVGRIRSLGNPVIEPDDVYIVHRTAPETYVTASVVAFLKEVGATSDVVKSAAKIAKIDAVRLRSAGVQPTAHETPAGSSSPPLAR